MESLVETFDMLKESRYHDGKKNTLVFQTFIKDFNNHVDENYENLDMEFVKRLAEYSHSPHFSHTFKNKDLKKNLVKRCVVRPIMQCIR